VLKVNHPSCKEVILSANLDLPSADVELFVDFEGTNTCTVEDMSELPYIGGSNMVFMIGVGYIDPETKEWVYRDFTAHNLSKAEEERIALEFCNYLGTFNGKLSLMHWSHYEWSQWNHIAEGYSAVSDKWLELDANWVDLLRHFKERPIVVKGALGFGLKEIVGAMHKHDLVKSSYATSAVTDGADAMLQARRAEKEALEQGIGMNQTKCMKDIIAYNNLDCKVLSEVLNAVRLVNSRLVDADML
jgi:predicted RecB family nuclease